SQSDAIAALGVSGIVIWVSLRLTKETIDALTDRAPGQLAIQIQTRIAQIEDVTDVRRVRVRRAGNKFFTDAVIAAPRTLTFEQIHILSELVEKEAMQVTRSFCEQCDVDVVVHVEPIAYPSESVTD